MRIIDISQPIHTDMPRYPGDPAVRLDPWTSLARGDDFAVTALRLGTHTGTHVDAPAHCFAGGATIDALPLDRLCGPARVLDLSYADGTDWTLGEALARLPSGCPRLLLRTLRPRAAGRDVREAEWAGLRERDAGELVRSGVQLVGIDRLSIAAPNAELAVHRLLLGAGIVIVEGLVLEHVPEADYDLFCLPLRIAGGDGAPARAVLVQR